MMLKPFETTASAIVEGIHSGKFSVGGICEFFSARTETLGKELNTHLYWNKDWIFRQAAEQEKRIATEKKSGRRLRLAGVPIVVKDNICIHGIPTTAGSKILEGFSPIYNATVIDRLREEGAIFFGKASLDEFAMGSSNENSPWGPVKNPWNTRCVPGGSSGGSAAAVAADLAPLALGSDTGGSVRQPASFCGIVGMKPTYGRVSRYGLIAFGSSLDVIGPLARTVKDTALLFDVLSGHDERDSTTLRQPPARTSEVLAKLGDKPSGKGLRVGVVKELVGEGNDKDVSKAFQEACRLLKDLGCEVVEISLPNISYSIATYYILATAEASSNLARFDGIRYGLRVQGGKSLQDLYVTTRSQGFGKEVKQRIMLGTFVLSSGYYDAYYNKANQARELIRRDFKQAFEKVDLLVSPTSPTTAFEFGQKSKDSMSMYLSDVCTIAANLAGIPALSIPCGFDGKGLPIGLQFLAPHGQEETMLKGAYVYEQSANWYNRHPKC